MNTTIQYAARSLNLETEKAFSTDFPVDHVEGAIRFNTQADIRPVTVKPIEDPSEWKLDVHGFCVLQGAPNLDLERVYTDKAALSPAYWYEIEAVLHKAFPQYSRIEAFDFTARKRDADFPELIRAYRNAYEQPSPVAHVDWSPSGALTVLDWCFPGNEGFFQDKKFDMLNVWRLIRQPTDDWPLALCDYTTIDTENDIRLNDAIRRDRVEELCILHHSDAHQWYYLKNQQVDDLIVFRNADDSNQLPRAFHAAVHNPMATGPARESVEVRLVAFY